MKGWEELDVILFSGDAYVDHPSFGPAVIGRILESYGLRVAIVPQPSVNDNLQDFEKLGKPRLFFAATGGCMDPMVSIIPQVKEDEIKMHIHQMEIKVLDPIMQLLLF